MNRRIVIIDDNPELGIDLTMFGGIGLTGAEIYTTSQLVGFKSTKLGINIQGLPEQELENLFKDLGLGDGVLLVGPAAFPILRKWYHFGIRGENYYDCSRLKRLGTNAGFFVKTVYHETDLPLGEDKVRFFMSPDFCKVREFPALQWKVISQYQEALDTLNWLLGFSGTSVSIGYDYEGSGMAMDRYYRITGASFAIPGDTPMAVFFSFTDLIKNLTPEQYADFLIKYREVLVALEPNLWVYNAAYEAQVTWRTWNLELDFKDASVYNYVQGLNSKRYSLKYTVQRVEGGGTEGAPYLGELDLGGVLPWDTEFDDLEDIMDRMFYDTIQGTSKKDIVKTPKCSPLTYQGTPEWALICQKYGEYIQDFRELIENPEYFGNPFLCIPSAILGKYCCLDSYYTVMIHETLKANYSELCVSTYQGNLSLGQKLTRGGLYIDDNFRTAYDSYCDSMMLFGIVFVARYMVALKMEKHQKKANKLSSYPADCQTLIKRGEFFGGNPVEIIKNILATHIDQDPNSTTGLDAARLVMSYGDAFGEWIYNETVAKMAEIKFKGLIDSGVIRKKKLLGVLAESLTKYLGLDKLTLGTKHEELEKYLYYEKGSKILAIIDSQIPDINNIPEFINIPSVGTVTKGEAAEWVMNTYYKCSSPIVNSEFTEEYYKRFKNETLFLASIGREMNNLPGEKKYYSGQGITDPATAFAHWMGEYQVYLKVKAAKGSNWPSGYKPLYPGNIWITTHAYSLGGTDNDAIKDIWNAWKGYDIQDDYFEVSANWGELKEKFTPALLKDDPFKQHRLILINSLLYKKYSKIKSTYINGLFYDNSKYVIDTPALMPLRDADPGEPGAVKKCFVKAEVLLKETKRWSSGYHTVPSHMDAKSCVGTPTFINPQTGKKTATFLSYFDISSAEVRTLGYKSGDANLINLFETGKDVYIHTAVAHLGKDKWDALSKGEQKKQRKIFKVVFLAVAYRMSARTLGENLNVPEQEAQGLIDTLFNEFPTLKGFIEAQCGYPETHDGLVNTFLGDHLQCTDWRYRWKLDKYGRKVIDHMKIAKCQRAGINYKIQNYSAVSLANGFNNVQIQAKKKGILAKNIIVVHDSCQNLVSMNEIFDILDFYLTEFMEFCYSLYGIRFMFDLEVGTDYANMLTLSQGSEKDKIKLTGNGSTLLEFLRRINEESDLQIECDTPIEQIQPHYITDAHERFISDRQCCMVKDTSKYTIELRKLN